MNSIIIMHNDTIKTALEKLQKNKKRFLICLDDKKYLLGVVTDGDIRRAFLNSFTLEDKIDNVYCHDFQYLYLTSSFSEVCEKFKSEKIDFLPIINKDKKLVNIITKRQFHIMLLENIDFNLSYDFSQFNENTLEHEIYNRPWGFYKSTILTPDAQSKIIIVFPHSELSFQKHAKRDEHWIIIKGKGKVILGEEEIRVSPGKYVYIPKECKHQIINESSENLIFSEVQLGEYFGEDDIIRYRDKYGRK
ncbi:CBS domain-containing protein [Halarcobacter ebronensis]|uniref:Mannose-1-phosphate guanylyltransferase n=1 Tax=Halarcobacter ebronensis TaxID=1462615 RepID=A0A4Q1ARH5_9BACT|nr:CBS domain-containing protein [Halarcobacter ebronensis]QKF81084.1 mannose-1-phosphate guanylyltransferase/mannose-6-phosphate isomerase [Halarcobacter ebronensis]RXK06389.1 mannose-1-phosphate guanylyltransferase [Halarcobacter ebronensis]